MSVESIKPFITKIKNLISRVEPIIYFKIVSQLNGKITDKSRRIQGINILLNFSMFLCKLSGDNELNFEAAVILQFLENNLDV